MLLHAPSTTGEVKLLSLNDPSPPKVPCSPDVPFFRPLPPLPSASALHLPSFLDLSTQSLDALADPLPRRSATSLPASALFRVSPSPVPSSRRAARKTRNNKVIEGPQWIPAFHHPNSPYVPWSSPVRRRILPPTSPLPPSPLTLSSPRIRPGAVAPEPWASSTFSQAHDKSRKERLSRSWKSFRNSVKDGVRTAVSHLGRSTKPLRTLCTGQDMLRTYDDTNTAFVQPHVSPDAMQAPSVEAHSRGSHDSLASFVSSDSRTLAAWLAERRATATRVSDGIAVEMSVEAYELVGSWLDLRHRDEGWLCGIDDCDVHTVGGSPCAVNEYANGLRTAMPFDSADLLSAVHPPPSVSARPFPLGPFSAARQFHSLPRLPCQTFDIHSTLEAERCMGRRELSMPGGWTFS